MPCRLSEADRFLWNAYAGGLAPLRNRTPAAAAASPTPAPIPTPTARPAEPGGKTEAKTKAPRSIAQPLTVGTPPGGLDKATWKRFRSGRLTAGRTLDLHGMTTQRAFQALLSFLQAAHAEQIRCVEVVTGRGSAETGGIIRREFPHWLNRPDIRPLILGAAHPHALNPGSVRLILRRIR